MQAIPRNGGAVGERRAEGLTARDTLLRGVLDALPAAIYATDAKGRITYYNEAAAALAGRRPVLGADEWCVTWRLYWPDGRPMPHDQCPMAVALKENRAVRGTEAILERPDGTRIPFIPYPTPLHDASGRLIGAVNLLVDISAHRTAESARAYLAAIVESSDDAIVSKDLNGIVTSWNRGAEAIFGYAAAEAIGRSIALIYPPDRLHEEDMIIGRLRRGERVDHFETVRRHKDGRLIDVSLTISPVRDDAGQIIGASKIARDITDRKRSEEAQREVNELLERRVSERTRELANAIERERAEAKERERAEAALRQAQKMEAIGQLASGMAHDFNNLLTAILGNLELLDMRLADEHLRKLVHAAARSAQRGARLNEQVLAFSRKQHLAARSVDLNGLVEGIDDMLARTLGGTIEVTTALSPGLWPALVDPHQLEVVILNLAINARDAMPSGGRVTLATRNIKASELDPTIVLAPGDYVCIAVSDTGTGMSEEVLARACEPFYTTKDVGRGSGLGLSQVYGMAQQSGGGLRIKSTLGRGTTVEVYLPRSHLASEATERQSWERWPSLATRGTILVVDDQDDVREVAVAQLEALGFRVAQATSGKAALELLAKGGVDLLMADYAMPGMSGLELARAARKHRPGMPVLLMSGYVETAGIDRQVEGARLVKKPYRLAELVDAIESLLRRRPVEVEGNRRTVIPLRAREE